MIKLQTIKNYKDQAGRGVARNVMQFICGVWGKQRSRSTEDKRTTDCPVDKGEAIAQAADRRVSATAVKVWTHFRPYGICGGYSDTEEASEYFGVPCRLLLLILFRTEE
jgi:hypothetical protein